MCPGEVAQHQPARLDQVLHDAAERFGIEIAGKDGMGHGLLLAFCGIDLAACE
jgi:hypothetical protein